MFYAKKSNDYLRAAAALLIPIPLGPLFLIRKFKLSRKMYFIEVVAFSLLALLCINSLVSIIISQQANYYGIKIAFTMLGIFVCSYVFSSGLKNFSLVSFINLALMVHLIVIFLEFFYPSTKNITQFISRMDVYLKMNVDYRVSGLFDGFDIAGIIFGFGALALVFQKQNHAFDQFFWIRIVFFFFGALLCSRTGMILVFIAFFTALIRSPKAWIPALALVAVFATLIIHSDALETTLLFMFDIVANYLDSGDLSNQSSQDLFDNNWFLPSISIFGSGAEPWSQGVRSDVGYVQALDIFGVAGVFILTAFYISLFLLVLKRSREYIWFIPCLFFVAIKGSYFWSPPLMVLLGIIVFFKPDNFETSLRNNHARG